jgi:hypothetical protein
MKTNVRWLVSIFGTLVLVSLLIAVELLSGCAASKSGSVAFKTDSQTEAPEEMHYSQKRSFGGLKLRRNREECTAPTPITQDSLRKCCHRPRRSFG